MINIEKAKLVKIILVGDVEHGGALVLSLDFMVQLNNVKVLTTDRIILKGYDVLSALVRTFNIQNFFRAPEKIGEECRIAVKNGNEILGFSHKDYDDWFSFKNGKVTKEQIVTEE